MTIKHHYSNSRCTHAGTHKHTHMHTNNSINAHDVDDNVDINLEKMHEFFSHTPLDDADNDDNDDDDGDVDDNNDRFKTKLLRLFICSEFWKLVTAGHHQQKAFTLPGKRRPSVLCNLISTHKVTLKRSLASQSQPCCTDLHHCSSTCNCYAKMISQVYTTDFHSWKPSQARSIVVTIGIGVTVPRLALQAPVQESLPACKKINRCTFPSTWLNSRQFTNQPASYALLVMLPFPVFLLCERTHMVRYLFLMLHCLERSPLPSQIIKHTHVF